MTDRLLSAAEVAEMLSVPETWVREHTRSGVIPHVSLGRYIRYRRDDVLKWLETLAAGGGPQFRRHAPTRPRNRAGDAVDAPAHGKQEVSPDASTP